MPKDPPYYARITFRVTVTKFLPTAPNTQVDYDWAIGQQGMRHFGTFRIHNLLNEAGLEGMEHAFQSMLRAHLGDVFPHPVDWDVSPSLPSAEAGRDV